jgi:hypothetical protein
MVHRRKEAMDVDNSKVLYRTNVIIKSFKEV